MIQKSAPTSSTLPANAIAITGLAGRFPGAPDIDAFWKNLCGGVESLRRFSAEEMASIAPELSARPEYVPVRGVLDDAACFDAPFFGVSPREAEVMDPQHRVFLECCWHALEDSGRIADRRRLATGVFAGQSLNTYLLANLARDRAWLEKFTAAHQTGEFATLFGNDKDYLASRVAHKLDLHGPAVTIQCACSTSLVAVVQAVQSLVMHQTDLCLAGGVSISFPQQRGHLYEEGAMVSRDGACRPFDADAAGTVFGAGAGVVVLRRLEDAVADGDRIYAVIRGAAVNNDGAAKSSYTAPSIEGQAEVITTALILADVPAETIGYVEAHGTGTPLGDPIEVAALTRAFRDCGAQANNFCTLGSLKGNIGHLEASAGVAGLIKAALAVHQGVLPPTLHFKAPNPRIDFANSPFVVSGEARAWPQSQHPRRAGVSSFGVGGTNAHVVLEQAPELENTAPAVALIEDRPAIAVLSAKTAEALSAAATKLADHVEAHDDLETADIAATLQDGRDAFRHRLAVVARDRGALMRGLRDASAPRRAAAEAPAETPPVVFMFPGQGSQRAGMARDLYRAEPVFRETIDECAPLLETRVGCDIRELLLADFSDEAAAAKLRQTQFTQPCIFATELALARLWQSWGVQPAALIGHSVGEYVAATLAGIFSLEDALAAVAERGALVQSLPAGAMLAVRLTPAEIEPLLDASTNIAAINAPGLCVVAGPEDAISALEKKLEAGDNPGKRLATSHAFHSAMMDPIVAPLGKLIGGFKLNRAALPIASTVTGAWLGASEAADPHYWAQHARRAVRFSDALGTILSRGPAVLLEVGPGRTLLQLARLHPNNTALVDVVASLPLVASGKTDGAAEIAEAAARLWTRGVALDWRARERGAPRRVVSLPGYPFARTKYFVEPPALADGPAERVAPSARASASAPGASPHVAIETTTTETRRARVDRELREVLERLFGSKLESETSGRSFFDFGFDSLLLTQAASDVRQHFGVEVTFRQLIEQFTSPAELAAHIEAHLPDDWFDPEPSPTPPVVAETPATPTKNESTGDLVEEIVARQLAMMEQQLAMLRDVGRGGKTAEVVRARIAALAEPVVAPVREPARATVEPRASAAAAATTSDAVEPVATTEIAAPDAEKRAPLTEEQREVWLACQLGPTASVSFNECYVLALRGDVDRAALEQAVRDVVARHEGLRTVFASDGSAQIISPRSEIVLRDADAPADEPALKAWLREEAARPFDLERGPLARFLFVKRHDGALLVIGVHHLVCDGWSFDTVFRELGEFYSAVVRGDKTGASRPAAQMSQFAAEETVRSTTPAARASRDFWTRKLQNPPSPIELPTNRTRPSVPSFAGDRESFVFSAEESKALKDFARARRCTLFTLLYTGFGALLHRLSGARDILVGVPVAGQNVHGVSSLVGHCVHYLPTRHAVSPETPFEQHLRRTGAELLEAFEHPHFTLGQLVRDLKWMRDPSRPAPLGITFTLDPVLKDVAFEALEWNLSLGPRSAHSGDLCFNLIDRPEGITVECSYSTDLFSRTTIARWLRHYATLLDAAMRTPTTPVGRLPLLDVEQRRRILETWNPPASAVPEPGLLHRLFEHRAARSPDAEAVRAGEQSLTYRELEMNANRLARHLVALGAGPDRCIAVLMDRSIDFAIAVLGVLKSGSAFVPIDPAWPTDRQVFVLRDCAARVLVTAGLSRPDGAPADTPQVDLVKEREFLARLPSKPATADVEPRHLAYVIYTSGSTGQPKGVMIEHRAVAAHIPSIARVYGFSPEDRSLFFHSVAFDPAVEQLFAPLSAGATVVIRGDVLWTGREFAAEIRRQKLTVVTVPPLYWLQMLRDWEEEPGLAPVDQLRLVTVGGEMLPESAVRLWRQLGLTSIRVVNAYGPTECTVTATMYALPADPARDIPSGRVPIGRPHGPVEAYLLDAHFEPVPIGVPGEICLAGPTLARGYLGRDALTRAHFVAHPFREGARMYRTGDHGRFLDDGTIEFLGRLDRQVKIRGYRIELGEIETILGRAAGVRACAVAPEKGPDGITRLAAYYVAAEADAPSEEKLVEALRAQLPAYSVPARLVRVEALPQTVNGKVDFTALAAVGHASPASEAEVELAARATALTSRVATILAEAAGIDRLGSHENFFDAGGHSLVALRAIARLNREFNGRLTLSDVFQAPTAAGLADRLATSQGASSDDAAETPASAAATLSAPSPALSEGPLLSAQRSLWFLDRLEPESAFYNTVHAIRMRGDLDRVALSNALDALVARHPALRSIFPDHDGEPVQVVQPARAVQIIAIDVSREPQAAREASVQRELRAEIDRPFALDRDPLLRAMLVRVASGDHVLMLATHHIAADGWSFDVMFEDLAELYRAAVEKRAPALPPAGRTPLELAIEEAHWLASADAARQLAFWKEHLAGAPRELPLPFDTVRTPASSMAGGTHAFDLDRGLMDEVRRLARHEDATLFMTFLAALAIVLRRWSGANDLVIGTPVALRDQPERDRTVAMLVNTVPVRLRPSEEKAFADLVRETREAARAVFDHRDFPFDLLVEKLGGRRSTRHPLFQVLFTMGAEFGSTRNWRKLDVTPIELESSSTKFELTLSVTETPDGARVVLEYMRDLFEPATIAGVARMFTEVLMAAVDRENGQPMNGSSLTVAAPVDEKPPVSFSKPAVTTSAPVTATSASIERRMSEIWRELLGTAEVRAESDFFDSGGHSLMAIRLFSRIEREFGVNIPVRELFEDATFGGLVARIRQRRAVSGKETPVSELRFAFPIQRHGDRPPLFLFTGSRGSEEEYLELNALVRALGKDQPVWGMRMGGHDRLKPEHTTTEEMAREVIKEIRQLQPEGPYHLAGECIGGRLAYEAGRQLELGGQTIAFLGLFDSECPRAGDSARFWIRDHWITDLYRRFLQKMHWVPRVPARELPRFFAGRAYWAMWRVLHELTPAPVPRDRMPERALDYYYAQALIRYRPQQAINCPLTVFVSDEFPLVADPMRWTKFTRGGVELIRLEGDHLACLRENSAASAARVRACLDAVAAGHRTAPRVVQRPSPALRKYLTAGS